MGMCVGGRHWHPHDCMCEHTLERYSCPDCVLSMMAALPSFLPTYTSLHATGWQRRYAQAPPRARKQTDTLGVKAGVHHLYRRPAMLEPALATLLRNAQLKASPHIVAIDAELVLLSSAGCTARVLCRSSPSMLMRQASYCPSKLLHMPRRGFVCSATTLNWRSRSPMPSQSTSAGESSAPRGVARMLRGVCVLARELRPRASARLLRETYEPEQLTSSSYYDAVPDVTVVEVRGMPGLTPKVATPMLL